jgi:NADPH:quinone reductase-like Zn-dependent oxidoreductase
VKEAKRGTRIGRWRYRIRPNAPLPGAEAALSLCAGIRATANAVPGGEVDGLGALTEGGRLATITGAPPAAERGIRMADVIVRPDGEQLRELAAALAHGTLHLDIGASYPLPEAARGLARAATGVRGAVVLEP